MCRQKGGTPMPDIIEMQRALARKALSQPNHRFDDLYGLVRDIGWLRTSLEAILANIGAKTAGDENHPSPVP